jgi:anti-sigma factor RsiW
MPDCPAIDPLVTSYVDGELSAAQRESVERHIRLCAPCRARVARERTVHDLLAARRMALGSHAPATLRARCEALTGGAPPARDPAERASRAARAWFARVAPFALAATLVLIVASAFLYQVTKGSARVMAAELTADHVKCFAMDAVLGTHQTPQAVESSLASGFDWHVELPKQPERVGLELVGCRPCLYGQGRIAHIMYRHNGQPVSLFMLPRSSRSDELMQIFGHEAAIWSVGNRTFVLIAREDESSVARLEAFVQSSVR